MPTLIELLTLRSANEHDLEHDLTKKESII